MTKDPNFVSVRLPDDVANWLREYATTNNMVRADKPNMGGSIIAIVRAAMKGQTISNNVGQSSAAKINATGIEAMIDNAIVPLLARLEALENTRSETSAPSKKAPDAVPESEGDSNTEITGNSLETETLPILDIIASLPIEKPLPDETLREAIAASKKSKITYRLNNDGSVILRSLRGITDKELKRMSNDELRAIGFFKTLRGKDEKFFPNDETLKLQYQEKAIATTKRQKSKHTSENLASLTTADLRKIYRDSVPYEERKSDKKTKAEYATKEFMIEAILKA